MYFFDRRFVSSNGWLRNFAKLFKFSCQRPRLAHRPVISLTHLYYEYTFLNEVQTLSPQYDTSLIINMDETMIRQVSSPRRVWGKKNHPWRNVNTINHTHAHTQTHTHTHTHSHTLDFLCYILLN